MEPVIFIIPHVLPLLNRQLRTHWSKRRRDQRDLAWEVVAAVGPRPHNPISPARVTVERYGVQVPDDDNLAASAKGLLDVLCMPSERHPCGLGLIVDDAPGHCELVSRFVKVRHRADAQTRVVIEARQVGGAA